MKPTKQSRRKFLGNAATAAAFSVVPFNIISCTSSSTKLPNSKVNGVQLGLTTYSYRQTSHGIDEVLGYVLEAGVNALEMRSVLEEGLGIPKGPGRPPRDATDEQREEYRKEAEAAKEAQRKWRLSLPMSKYEEVRKKYNKAGVDIHIAKFAPSSWSDEELDYAYEAANVLGAYGITDEARESAWTRMGKFAEKHNSLALYHTHAQFADPEFDVDAMLAASPANRLNLDIGHYVGTTGKHPNDLIIKYHDQIPMIHIKDKTNASNPDPNSNREFGKGETPIADVLNLIKEEQWPIDCFLELEYAIPDGSDPVKEVNKCIEYMRNILE
ncbi:MAG: sugar phosphate isomerase/epimerase family protein [Bacteroidota bacterium]